MRGKKREKIKFSKELTFAINIILLLIHMYLLAFFAICHMSVMAVVNVFSIGVYVALMRWVKEHPYFFLKVTFWEILFHMILAIVFVGWDFGFQFYCFALIPLVFFCDHLSKTTSGKSSYPITWSIFVIFCFLGLRIYTWNIEAIYYAKYTLTVLFSAGINAVFIFVFLIFYIANYESLTLKNEKLATRDQLTGLNNRHKMHDIMESVQEQNDNYIVSIAMLDIDNFKKVNDTYGHDVGDLVLKDVAEYLRKAQDDRVIACRWGGEEFLVLAIGEDGYGILQKKMAKLVEDIGNHTVNTQKSDVRVTITVGVAVRKEAEEMDDVIRRADAYLYEGKLTGKNKMVAGDGEVY